MIVVLLIDLNGSGVDMNLALEFRVLDNFGEIFLELAIVLV